jgi:crotonobetaine/carnitine-CoA ligase
LPIDRATWDARCRRIETVPLPSSMGALVDDAGEAYGDRPFCVFFNSGRALSFAELARDSRRAANALGALGVRRGGRVAVFSWNVPHVPIVWFALARLGAAIVWVNARYTARELDYVLRDSEAELLLVHPDLVHVYEEIGEKPERLPASRVVRLGEEFERLLGRAAETFAPMAPVGPDDLVNIQYTSGTTGFPKGCMLTQRYWLTVGWTEAQLLGFRLRRALYNQNLFYVDGPIFLMLGLYTGAAVYIVDRPSVRHFVPWVREHGLEYCYFFEAILKEPESPLDRDCGLELVHTFGLTRSLHAGLEARYGCLAREAFGMTECGAGLVMPNEADDMVGSGSCGWPAPFRESAILDPSGRPVAVGEVGELWLKGPGMMRGYWRRPEADAETFRGGWMRTGDLFRVDERGFHTIVGRLKEMIRRNAENIAVREVEEVLRTLPGVAEVAVVPVPDAVVGEEVKAYLQLAPGVDRAEVNPAIVLDHCRRLLAPFKVPRYIAYRSSFPKTDSDRVEKKTLLAESPDLRADSFDRVDGIWR